MSGAMARYRTDSWRAGCAAAFTGIVLAACGGGASPPSQPAVATDADRVAVGDKLFREVRLSASGGQSCASCHVPERAHGDAVGSFLPLGGPGLDQQGPRTAPSLHYLNANRPFGFDTQGRPEGGFMWDGRADSRAAQTLAPLLAAHELANADTAAVVRTVRALPYFADLRFAYALPADAPDAQVLQATQQALADYQQGDVGFQPFTSKFDFVQQGRARFTVQEARGQALFDDNERGNCASCHPSVALPGQVRAVFTNFGYVALGLPRNHSAATADPGYFDMGLCGPVRTDLADRTELCGFFKVPTLRNVALTAPYFHNGVLNMLEDAVAFYATRDTDPARWYPTVDGVVQRFNDLPTAYRRNVRQLPPFGGRPGDAPRLNPQDVQDIAAFLRTLSDGYAP